MKFYREEFPRTTYPKATVIPKMHLLEDHMKEWLERFHVGTGLMGEQGAVSIHSHLNDLQDRYPKINNKVDRLKYIFEMYNLETEPSLQALKPEQSKRKRKRSGASEE